MLPDFVDALVRRRPGLPAPAALLAPALLAAPPPAAAQSAGSSAATPEEAVRGIFDAMRAADSAVARRYLHPETRLHRPVEKDGEAVLQITPVQGWLDAIGGAEPGELDEKIWDVEVRREGGWQVFGVSDTSREEGCEEPPEGG